MKLITLDFEGTMVDFQWKLDEAVDRTLGLLSSMGVPGDIFSGMDYAGIYNLVRQKEEDWGFPVNHLGVLLDQLYDHYDLDAASRWRPVDGLAEVLDRLGGYSTALVSNVGKRGLMEALAKMGVGKSFGLIVTRNDVSQLKPAGEGLLKAMEWAGAVKENTLHVGDSLSDLGAARKAGVRAAIVLGGENPPEMLARHKPDILLDKLSQLPEALKSINF